MDLLQSTMAPISASFGKKKLSIPKMMMDDIVAWASAISEEETSRATANLDDHQTREFLIIYPPRSPSMQELRARCDTPAGIRYVLKSQLPKATVTDENDNSLPALTEAEIGSICNGSPYHLAVLTTLLADLIDTSKIQRSGKSSPENGNGGGTTTDPLKR